MRTAFRKVWRDLWQFKGRTTLVVLSITVGIVALGMTLTSNRMMNYFMDSSRLASNPAHTRMNLQVPFDDQVVEIIQNLPEVEQAEGWASTTIRWRAAPGQEWQDASLIAKEDYRQQVFDLIELKSGDWPGADTVAVELNHMEGYGVPAIGETVFFEGANQEIGLTLVGAVRDPSQSPPPFNLFNQPAFYVSMAGLELLTGSDLYRSLRFSIPDYSEENADRAALVVEDRLERLGVKSAAQVLNIEITDPDRSRAQEFLDGLGLILVTMALMSLGLSIFLVINTINAIIANQVKQIGIMKAIGGIRRQISIIYLSGVAAYGLLSLLIALPLATLSGFVLTRSLLFALNVEVDTFFILPEVLLSQVGVGLVTPLLAALWPVVRGTGIPAREAIGSYGIGHGLYGTRRLDRVMSNIRGIPRLTALTLRNTFRRMGRAALTELTLIGAGAIFMMVVTTGASFNSTIDDIWEGWGFEIIMVFDGFQRVEEIRSVVLAHPQVEGVEMWIWLDATAHLPGRTDPADLHTIALRGVPEETGQFAPRLVAGRLITEQDGHAVVLNQKLAQDMNVGLGDEIVVDLPGGRQSTWTIVGLAFDIAAGGNQDTAFMNRTVLSADLHESGQATVAQIQTYQDSRAVQDSVVKHFEEYFDQQGVRVAFAMGQIENKELATALWSLIGGLLQLMSVLMAFVGSIGLSGTLSINVIERRREIGVMRAVGASSLDVSRIFIGEGMLLGVVSWVLAVPLSMLMARSFVRALGETIQFPFYYRYSVDGMWIWLGVIIFLSFLASWLPARRAASISVRESLAYE